MMSAAKFQAVWNGQTSQAKKVYEAIPIKDAWTAAQVHGELQRLQHSSGDVRIVAGCINTLITSGLVREVTRGHFCRAEIKSKPIPGEDMQAPRAQSEPAAKAAAVQAPSPIERMTALSARAREVVADLRILAEDMDNAALEMEAEIATASAEGQKLKQLQLLLKSLA